MKKIRDPAQIHMWMEKGNIRDCFSTPDLDFQLYRYEKGEQITSPDKRLEELLFVVKGTIRVYGLRNNGTISPVNQQNAPILLGDIEFAEQGPTPFFAEAVTDVICIALAIQPYEKLLHTDIRFLHVLLHAYAEKLQLFAFVEAPAETIADRVLLYLKNFCPTHELNGIEAAVLQLRCSRRQLQRVLQKLCAEGEIEKIGRGRYRLATHAEHRSGISIEQNGSQRN